MHHTEHSVAELDEWRWRNGETIWILDCRCGEEFRGKDPIGCYRKHTEHVISEWSKRHDLDRKVLAR